mgnify:CR=1 FL=1
MKNISEYINVETNKEFLNEAVQERHVLALIKQLSSFGFSIKDIFGRTPDFKISDMDGSRVKEYNYIDNKVLNDVKKKLRSGGYMFWGILDDKIAIVLINSYGVYFVPTEKPASKNRSDWEYKNPVYFNIYANKSETSKLDVKINAISECDEIWEFRLNSNDIQLHKLRFDRQNSKKDVWDNSPEFYAKWLEKNRKKYIAALAIVRSSKTIDVAKITKRISVVSSEICSLLSDLSANMSIYAYDFLYNCDCNQLSTSMGKIFNKVALITDAQKELTRSAELNYTDPQRIKERLETYANAVNKELDDIEKKLVETKQKREDILKNKQ